MSLDAAIFDHLSSNLSCGDRVYPMGRRPQRGELPAVTFQVVTGPTTHYSHGGPSDHIVSYQFDCWAEEPDDAIGLATELQALLDGARGDWSGYTIGSSFLSLVLDDFDTDARIYRRMRQAELHYTEPLGS